MDTRSIEFITPAPSTPVGPLGIAQTVANQVEKAGRVALHHKFYLGILRAKRTLPAHVLVKPRIVHEGEISADEATMKSVAADSAPRREVVGPA